jgi:hypothetical protein
MKSGKDLNSDILTFDSQSERQGRAELFELFRASQVSDDQQLGNLGLFLDAKHLSRLLLLDFLYQKIIDVHGVVMDFGTRWGQNMVVFQTLRSLYEPFNRHRKVVGFDTFQGFPGVEKEDGQSPLMFPGNLELPDGYPDFLSRVLSAHESLNPLSHIQKNEVIVGDVMKSLPQYLEQNPHTIVALAYFDFDIYQPTKLCLDTLKERITKGTVLAFDELNDPDSPGETLAVMEALGLPNVRLQRYRYASRVSYLVVE